MANLSSEMMTQKSCRSGIAIAGMSRMGAAPTDATKLNADGTLINKRSIALDGAPDDTVSGWSTVRT